MNINNIFGVFLLIYSNLFIFGETINNCQKLWDINNKINGVEIYKMGLYACIEEPLKTNLGGNTLNIEAPPLLNLTNSTNGQTNKTLSNTQNVITTTTSPLETNATTTKIDHFLPTSQEPTTTQHPDTATNSMNDVIAKNNLGSSMTNISIANNTNIASKDAVKNAPIFLRNSEKTIIIILSSCLGCCFCLVLYFVLKAHKKYAHHKNIKKENVEHDIESQSAVPKHLVNINHFKNKFKAKTRAHMKNRNSWSKDIRVKPEKTALKPKLPNTTVNTYKNKKPGLTLNTTDKNEKKINIRELKNYKTESSFVPGSPRRRLPTPPNKAPPPPLPKIAAQNLATKRLDFLAKSSSPKIQRIVHKNK